MPNAPLLPMAIVHGQHRCSPETAFLMHTGGQGQSRDVTGENLFLLHFQLEWQ